jgi:hypothetical protein
MTDPVERKRGRWGIGQLGDMAMWLELGVYVAVFALFVAGVFFGR